MTSDQSSIDDIIKQAKQSAEGGDEAPGTDVKIPEAAFSPGMIIDRLDDVTLQSETEASKVVDLIDQIMSMLSDIDSLLNKLTGSLKRKNTSEKSISRKMDKIASVSKEVQDMLFNAMNLLQYQDILRQKVEKIAASLCVFYDYLGAFLGKGKKEKKKKASKVARVDVKKTDKKSGKIIDLLDDVTSQSEVEADKVIARIDEVMTFLSNMDKAIKDLNATVMGKKEDKLEIVKKIGATRAINSEAQDMLFNIMNLLQYQDIIRQKIEKAAESLGAFYDYLGDFLGKGKIQKAGRATGKHIEDSTLERDQKLDEIDNIIKDIKGH
jgi:phosphoribosyl-ATP pyrophosphohydrolase